jgi:hypothetical protein
MKVIVKRRIPYIPHIVISATGVVLAGVHAIFPNLKVDAVTLGLLVISALPWLGSVFKSLELPGGFKFEYQKLVKMNEEQIRNKSQAEADSVPEQPAPLAARESQANKYREIETKILTKIEGCFSRSYKVLLNRRLGATEYDAVLCSYSDDSPDLIIEIKFVPKGLRYGWLRDVCVSFTTRTQLYRLRTGRDARGIVLVVFASGELLGEEAMTIKEKVLEELGELGADLKIAFLREEDLESLDCLRLGMLLLPKR